MIMDMMQQEMKYWFEFRLSLESLAGGEIESIIPDELG